MKHETGTRTQRTTGVRILAVVASATLVMGATGCGGDDAENEVDDEMDEVEEELDEVEEDIQEEIGG